MSRNTALGLVVGIVALVSLSACSSMQDKSASAADPTASKVVGLQEDALYMSRVERLARQRGIALTWVHPPVKRVQPQSQAN